MSTPSPASPTPAPAPSEFKESQMTGGPTTVMPNGGGDEKLSQHGKRAVIVAAILGGLVVVGLIVDGIFGGPKQVAAPKKDETQAAPAQDPFVDFEAKERLEAARLEQERKKRLAKEKALREAQAQEAQEAQAAAAAPHAAVAQAKSAEDEIRETARLDDLKRALGAVRSNEMVVGGTKSASDKAAAGRGGDASAGSGVRNLAKDAAGATGASPMLAQLKQAIDKARDGAFSRDLKPGEAAQAVVGQSATARRASGESQRHGEFLVPVGTVIPAILDMEVNSDWEGRWRGMITRDIYDISQDYILIPKGTRILGQVVKVKPVNEAINQRMALAAQWLVLPNGARIDMSRSGMLDAGGVGAIGGDVNNHYMAQLGGVVAYGIISGFGAYAANRADQNSTNASTVSVNGAGTTAGGEIAKGFTTIGQRVAERYLNLVPTITLTPGTSMNVFLDDEMFLQAWAPIDENSPPLPAGAPMRASR